MRYDEVSRAAAFVADLVSCRPEMAVILGSGLGAVADRFENPETLSYSCIPGFPESTVEGHAGQFVFGTLGGKPVAAMQGRFHFYEGHGMERLSFPVYVLGALGVKTLVVTNACGGINPSFAPGDLMLISDHLNFSGNNPLIGRNDERLGPRFPDMTEVYDGSLRDMAKTVAHRLGIPLKEGVYAFYSGPSFETAAEIRAFHILGADAVGMSTVPEAIVARYLGMKVLGISCITNMATGLAKTQHSHAEVLDIANRSSQSFRALLEGIIPEIP